MIELKDVKKNYGDRTVLCVDLLKIKKGERLSLTGANGSGKSTLLKIIAGIITCDGYVEVPQKVLYMPQKTVLFDMSVLHNVTYSLNGKRKEKEEKAMEALRKTGLSELYNKNALTLSGGEAARLALARILVNDCDVLLLDEPTGAVDVEGTEIVENALREYTEKNGCTLITATHSPLQAKRLSERVIMLQDGRIAEDCTPEEFFLAPKTDFGKKFVSMWSY